MLYFVIKTYDKHTGVKDCEVQTEAKYLGAVNDNKDVYLMHITADYAHAIRIRNAMMEGGE